MKIICDSCGAKYSIADEKVEGKVFKIRCKKCSEVIVVEGTDDGFDDAQDQDLGNYSDAYDGGAAAEWYVVIDGERVGPVTPDEVEGYFSSGQLHAESYVWKDGLDDWVMLETLDDFEHLIEDSAGPNEKTMIADQSGQAVSGSEAHVGQSHSASASDAGYGDGLSEGGGDATAVMDPETFQEDDYEQGFDGGDSHQPRETKSESDQYAAVESGSYDESPSQGLGGEPDLSSSETNEDSGDDYDSDQGGMFAAFDDSDDDFDDGYGADGGGGGFDAASAQQQGGASPEVGETEEDLVGARNENSVLFSLGSMEQSESSGGDSASSAGAPGQAQGNDKSGLIDIQSLASTHAAMKDDGSTDSVQDDEEFVANTMSMPALTPSGSQKSNKGLIIGVSIGAAVLAAVLSGAVVYLFVLDDDEQPAQQEVVAQADESDDEAADEDAADEAADEAEAAAEAALEAGEDEDEDAEEDEEADEDADEEEDGDEAQAEAEEDADEEDADEEEEAVAQREPSDSDSGSTGGGGGGTGGETAGGGGGTAGGGDSGGIAQQLDDDEDDEPEPEAEPEQELPDSLSRSMVQDTVQRYRSQVRDCAEDSNPEGLSGNAMVRFEVVGSGAVQSASAQGEFSGTEIGGCIEGVVRDMRFPETHDDSRTINFPFSVR